MQNPIESWANPEPTLHTKKNELKEDEDTFEKKKKIQSAPCNGRFHIWGYEELTALTAVHHFTKGTRASVDLGVCRGSCNDSLRTLRVNVLSIIYSVNKADSNQSELPLHVRYVGKLKSQTIPSADRDGWQSESLPRR